MPVQEIEVTFRSCTCTRCGANWLSRTEHLPHACPYCASRYWNRERVGQGKGKRRPRPRNCRRAGWRDKVGVVDNGVVDNHVAPGMEHPIIPAPVRLAPPMPETETPQISMPAPTAQLEVPVNTQGIRFLDQPVSDVLAHNTPVVPGMIDVATGIRFIDTEPPKGIPAGMHMVPGLMVFKF